MNKLITSNTGGFPLVLDDLRFIDEAIRESFSAVFKSFMQNEDIENVALIVHGCEKSVTGTFPTLTNTYSPGIVVLNGESLLFPGLVVSGVDLPRRWAVETTFDPSGDKIFKNGDTESTYQIRRAKLEPALLSTQFLYNESKRINDQILRSVKSFNSEWNVIPSSLYQDPFVEGEPKYMRDALGFVHLGGVANYGYYIADQVIGVLPVGYRPLVVVQQRIDASSDTVIGNALIRIETDGTIHFVGDPIPEVRLCQITPFQVA